MKNLFSIADKTVVITGGSRGLGAMMARGFLENGARVYISARKEGELMACAEELSAYGECIPLVADLGSQAGTEAFAKALQQREAKIDVLINNAGASWGAPLGEFPENGWDKIMQVNVKSMFFLTQMLLPQLKAAGSKADPARVINIASINGITHPKLENYSYSASKAAVIQLTRHMAADLAKDNVNINGIAPGFFASKLTAYIVDEESVTAPTHIPRGRLGQAEDIAGTAIYLASRASAWMCGHTLVLDGGSVAHAG
ncbi:SDR family NAD(P)-dependent oxidoreductase [Spongiibacter sp. KMU-166]|uniref:SDR family NAD(P)-dependent oxidoreductase n=1 Tax=Spongiibacter thalassae TaxID=2721624 RepID=A0ABX1GEA8_9GAMM|nr:SDR family NAD(P)-dependent oxidoreductase [Spongiibacter thalassae]NKI16883.1 SDR family NAD(P)-dependent oxidoreductase [Spongiibacter thalassae]